MEPDRVNACTFVGKRGFLFAQTHLDFNLDMDGTVRHSAHCQMTQCHTTVTYDIVHTAT